MKLNIDTSGWPPWAAAIEPFVERWGFVLLSAVAMDAKRGNFRTEIYPQYKANRPPAPDDLKQQMQRCGEVIAAFNIPILIEDGVEADDLIATAVKQARSRKLKVVVVSAKGDWEILAVNDFQSDIFATPAVSEARMYVRTHDALYAIGLER